MKACILSVSGTVLTDNEAALLADIQPWAVILMGRSCANRGQIRRLVDAIWQSLGRACLIFIDQEGGRVARLKAPEWPVFPPVARYGELFLRDETSAVEACYVGHYLMASELSALGIHADCSPVVDLTVRGAHDIIGDRAFSDDPRIIGQLARAAIRGLHDAGVASVIKHIPGHGRARADSHEELPVVADGANELAADFQAFEMVSFAPMAMTAHILYPEIDAAEPATTSATLISDVIRKRIGFGGLLMSDDLGMKALGGSLGSRAVRALSAGCDVALHCSGFLSDPEEILSEMRDVGEHSKELEGVALERALLAEAASCSPVSHDRDMFRDRFNTLMVQTGAIT